MKIKRNNPCPCGSGRKYKNCCLTKGTVPKKGLSLFSLLAVSALFIIFGLMAYHNSFSGEFIFDDTTQIVDNAQIRQLFPPWEIFHNNRRPVLYLSLAFNYAWGNLNVFGYHLFNVVIHILSSLALFGIIRRTLKKTPFKETAFGLALSISLIWLVHPLQTESVAYVIQRAESLAGLFFLLTLYGVIRSAEEGKRGVWSMAAVTACAFGMATKEMMVTCPLVVLVYDRIFLSFSFRELFRARGKLYAGIASTWGILAALLIFMRPEADPSAGFAFKDISSLEYALTQPGVILHYLKLSLWPQPLVFDYEGWPIARSFFEIFPQTVIILSLLIATVWALRFRPKWGFLGLWFFLILAPTSSIMPLADVAFEHRMYLPLAAVITVAVLGLYRLLVIICDRHELFSNSCLSQIISISIVIIGIIACFFTYKTHERNKDYLNEFVLWQDTVTKRPDNSRAHNNLGKIFYMSGNAENAKHHYLKAIELRSSDPHAYDNLGVLFAQQGNLAEAQTYFLKAIEIKPDFALAHINLGNVFSEQGKFNEAAEQYKQTLKLGFKNEDVYCRLGVILANLGKEEEAVFYLQEAVNAHPEYQTARKILERFK